MLVALSTAVAAGCQRSWLSPHLVRLPTSSLVCAQALSQAPRGLLNRHACALAVAACGTHTMTLLAIQTQNDAEHTCIVASVSAHIIDISSSIDGLLILGVILSAGNF